MGAPFAASSAEEVAAAFHADKERSSTVRPLLLRDFADGWHAARARRPLGIGVLIGPLEKTTLILPTFVKGSTLVGPNLLDGQGQRWLATCAGGARWQLGASWQARGAVGWCSSAGGFIGPFKKGAGLVWVLLGTFEKSTALVGPLLLHVQENGRLSTGAVPRVCIGRKLKLRIQGAWRLLAESWYLAIKIALGRQLVHLVQWRRCIASWISIKGLSHLRI